MLMTQSFIANVTQNTVQFNIVICYDGVPVVQEGTEYQSLLHCSVQQCNRNVRQIGLQDSSPPGSPKASFAQIPTIKAIKGAIHSS